ncbi:phosphoribosylamine-glycine ligase [Emydomyces testavorans]|uniref:phosphoribosylamine--glycine ligase n=1 Tax=Emydomyces testavorans TaxID=2070801 RepID=A0AAF0DLI3_9EURO|nr:phosphoribosylamine-glycine ligase [Emydomyces testavorans]
MPDSLDNSTNVSGNDRGLSILLVGKGAREHSLAWKLTQSPSVRHVYVVPGNGGTSGLPNVSNIREVEENDYPGLVALAKALGIGLVVVGPDNAVVDGIESYFKASGIPCFAPTKKAAEIEGSKTFAKDFMKKHNIPTAEYRAFSSYNNAKQYLEDADDARVVIKVDGLAAGKGVILPANKVEALQALREIMIDGKFGHAGQSVIIEEYLEGDEISILSFSDGKTFMSLPPGQDHKRIFDGNRGLNTGGMGVYAPLPFVGPDQMREINRDIIQPTLDGLKAEGRPFKGMLFTGIMMTENGPKVLEYNARFGDPETQTMMMLLAPECDLADVLLACSTGRLDKVSIPILSGYACNVVVAASGYPQSYPKGDTITLSEAPEGVQIFHAGTERSSSGELQTAGGRVFAVAAYAPSLEQAVCLAYRGVKCIQFRGMFYRKDIASRYEPSGTSDRVIADNKWQIKELSGTAKKRFWVRSSRRQWLLLRSVFQLQFLIEMRSTFYNHSDRVSWLQQMHTDWI